ncbi:Trigger factor [Mesomycoplasma conjunctivae]|uniref:Trigger factor n=1 Tax=Mesomycoplasma conjunctivae (strain ATCC 25834 / NCTC 10147 / HRC/581) TaxID=572263 RepID=C5J5K5_MESCH|nr:trigger factor [Mesomycoplasma conjunctivae]CAT04728.1 Trigger factor [Mesomycoplasma conjunctivae]VEU65733.1 Trigger factor [Mesomycoplasma conjunctivae]
MIKRELLKDTAELKISISAPSDRWESVLNKAEKKLISKVQIKGFRKGKVPVDKARAFIDPAKLLELAIQYIIPELETESRTNIMDDDQVIDGPVYNIAKVSKDELEIEFLYPVYPEIKLPDYKKLKTKYQVDPVSKEDVQAQIDKLLQTRGTYSDVDGPIEKNDVINFDFKGFIENEAFEGGEASDFDLKIGSGQFIPGFEEQLIGLKKEEEKDIIVTFPKEYHVPAFANKEATFKVKINKIKRNTPAELSNKFVEDLKIPNVTTISQLEDYLEDLTKRENVEKSRVEFSRAAIEELGSQVSLPISTKLLGNEMQRLSDTFKQTLKTQGFTLEEYLRVTKFTTQDIDDQVKTEATKLLKNAFIYAEIAKQEALVPTDEEINQYLENLSKLSGRSIEDLKTHVSLKDLHIEITNRKVLDKLIEYNSKATKETKSK